jgi:formimidoylglutamate deiminase
MPADRLEVHRRYFAPFAWVRGGWAQDVLLEADAQGHWTRIVPGARVAEHLGATRLHGPVLPGLVDAHSHAFQRAMAGLAERSPGGEDDFWSWRDRMYRAANRITPDQLEAVAAFLYAELLQAGYTQVCEFHYLHNDVDGKAYADPMELSRALARAAQRTGIGLTLLPTLYMRSGFAAKGLREDQRRFASTPASVMEIAAAVRRGAISDRITSGVALHSLRAVDAGALREVATAAKHMPVHIHIAEQRREVEDCMAEHGRSPVEFLLSQVAVDARWSLVHATQCTPQELADLRRTGAAVVLCPSTEANLGDGIFDLPSWMGQSGNWSIGSDSHVARSWREELRLLEYSQRLHLRRRNVAATSAVTESSAAALFQGALGGGSAAAGLPLAGLAIGQRADFIVIDRDAPELAGVPDDHLLDALVFSSPESRFKQVYVAGEPVSAGDELAELARGMREAMRELWS